MENNYRIIDITEGSYNSNYLKLSNISEFFPSDVFGGTSKNQAVPNTIEISWGSEEKVRTDIAEDKRIFRKRGWIGKFFKENELYPGDKVGIEKIEPYRYRVFPLTQPTPTALDMNEPSQSDRIKQETYRILRDTAIARAVKVANDYRCSICGMTLRLKGKKPYIEAHHIKPLGAPHNGPDVKENIICVCPNHHTLLDYGAMELDSSNLLNIGKEYVNYHNTSIYGRSLLST